MVFNGALSFGWPEAPYNNVFFYLQDMLCPGGGVVSVGGQSPVIAVPKSDPCNLI